MMEKLMQESSVLICLAALFSGRQETRLMNQMMIRGRLLATVATVVWLACVMGTEAKGANVKPPSESQDMGTLSAANDYNVLLDLTLKNGSPVVHTVDVGDIPASRSRLLLAVKTYWNKYPSFEVVDPSGIRH